MRPDEKLSKRPYCFREFYSVLFNQLTGNRTRSRARSHGVTLVPEVQSYKMHNLPQPWMKFEKGSLEPQLSIWSASRFGAHSENIAASSNQVASSCGTNESAWKCPMLNLCYKRACMALNTDFQQSQQTKSKANFHLHVFSSLTVSCVVTHPRRMGNVQHYCKRSCDKSFLALFMNTCAQ